MNLHWRQTFGTTNVHYETSQYINLVGNPYFYDKYIYDFIDNGCELIIIYDKNTFKEVERVESDPLQHYKNFITVYRDK